MTTPPLRRALRACAAPLLPALALAGCMVGPTYHRPDPIPAKQPTPPAFKELDGWTPAQPLDLIDRGAWWSAFGDPVLDGLERQVVVNNQNVVQAEASYREAVAIVSQARAGLLPTVSTNTSLTRAGGGGSSGTLIDSGGGSVITTGTTGTTGTGATGTGTTGTGTTGTGTTGTTTGGSSFVSTGGAQTRYSLGFSAAWTLDVWGRIRRQIEADRDNVQASAADLANATLSAQATLATDYFTLRSLDEQKAILTQTVAAYQRTVTLTENQYRAGTVARGDVISAQLQVLNSQAQLEDLGVQRAANEHAIAVLMGKAPAQLTLAEAKLPPHAPTAPTGVPSVLLQRRPDIASAERAVASANAQVGVAIAAYYPTISLSGSATSSSTVFSQIFNASNVAWSFGPRLTDTLLDFGARRAQVRQARAEYDRTIAVYRQTVLTAFQNVEDELAALRQLEAEQRTRDRAETAARQAEAIALNQYRAGIAPFTTVITAQAQSLSAQLSARQVTAARLQSSALLIQALGGGWTDADLPRTRDIR